MHNLVRNWVELWTTFIHLIFNFECSDDVNESVQLPLTGVYMMVDGVSPCDECITFGLAKLGNEIDVIFHFEYIIFCYTG